MTISTHSVLSVSAYTPISTPKAASVAPEDTANPSLSDVGTFEEISKEEMIALALQRHRELVASVTLNTDNTLDPVEFESTPVKDMAEEVYLGQQHQKLLDIYMSNSGAGEEESQASASAFDAFTKTPTEKALEKYTSAQNQHRPETLPEEASPPVSEEPEPGRPVPLQQSA